MPERPSSSPPAPPRILVVDDQPGNRLLLEAMLTGAGYEVVCAGGGGEALAEIDRMPPGLVLLDLRMPDIDGLEVCRRLRARPGPQPPVVIVTALTEDDLDRGALDRAGADDLLQKPIQRAELLLRVRSLLRLQAIARRKDELAALLVHDLKNPLASILANADFLAGDDALTTGVREVARDIVVGATEMQRLVLNLLDVARSEDGALVARLEDTPLDEVLEQTRRLAAHRAAATGRRLVLPPPSGLLVRADTDLLRRVLDNLVDNALRHTPDGVVQVEAEARDRLIELRVCDTGRGIPPDLRSRIFDKYTQLGDPATRGRTGRGLGLHFCRVAVEIQGGRIDVVERPPWATCFRIELPVAAVSAG